MVRSTDGWRTWRPTRRLPHCQIGRTPCGSATFLILSRSGVVEVCLELYRSLPIGHVAGTTSLHRDVEHEAVATADDVDEST